MWEVYVDNKLFSAFHNEQRGYNSAQLHLYKGVEKIRIICNNDSSAESTMCYTCNLEPLIYTIKKLFI